MAEIWTPPSTPFDGHELVVCSCEPCPYVGARKAGTPDCCEVCGFITPAQLAHIQAKVLHDAAEGIQRTLDEYERVGGPVDPLPTTLVAADRSGYLGGLRTAIGRLRHAAYQVSTSPEPEASP